MELRHIRYFFIVAEELSFTRAAERLCIAQPPLSRQIQDLEKELGAKLFVRRSKGLQLTSEGVLFKQYARQILSLVDKSVEEIREMQGGIQGTLYLASVEGHGPRLLSEWIAGFRKEYPHVQYSLWNGNSDDVMDRLMNGLCDLAIIMEPYNAEGLHGIRVYQEPWIAMIPPGHPLSVEGEEIELKELAGCDLIVPSRRSRIQEICRWFDSVGVEPQIRCEMAHMMNVYELTEQGVGIAIFPASAGEVWRDESIRVKKIVNPSVTASYVLIWNANRQLSHVAQRFIQFVSDSMQPEQG